jgi:RNA polymerase sigma-70 factor (ECF subfamily)
MENRRDEEAAARFRDGDPAGLEELYDRHADPLYRYIAFMAPDPESREEVFQETWIRLADILRKNGPPRHFRAYAIATARNLFRNRKRQWFRNLQVFEREPPAGEGERPSRDFPDPKPGPRDNLDESMLAVRLAEEVRRLPAREREVFLMRMEADMKFREIAEALGRPIGTVLARMRRATERLRKRLGDIQWDG